MSELFAIATFDGTDGASPGGGLVADAEGDLFGFASGGGANNDGVIFEIPKTTDGYARPPLALVSLGGTDNAINGPLIVDSAGDVFGTTSNGGRYGDGDIFEIPNTGAGYATSPIVLASFDDGPDDAPQNLFMDADGNLFATTLAGGADGGALVELAKEGVGYASAPTVVTNLGGLASSGDTLSKQATDSAGDIFDVVTSYVDEGRILIPDDSVVEIAKTATGYATTATLVANLGSDLRDSGLVADAAGNLFGETVSGVDVGDGDVFEIVKTSSGYASTPEIIASFDGDDGSAPMGGLTIDVAGNLFGGTGGGGTYSAGVLFEVAKTTSGYANTPTVLAYFAGPIYNYGDGANNGLIADSSGDLIGEADNSDDGVVFEYNPNATNQLTIAGINPDQQIVNLQTVDPFAGVTISDANSASPTETLTVSFLLTQGALANLAGGTYDAGTGVYTDSGSLAAVNAALDGLVFTPTITPGAVETTSFDIAVDDGIAPSVDNYGTAVTVSSIKGGGQRVNFVGAPGDAVSIYDTAGNWDALNGDDGTVFVTSAQITVYGGDDAIVLAGSDDKVELYATDEAWDGVQGSGGDITLNGAQTRVEGGDDAVYFTSGSGAAVSLYDTNGVWDGVSGSVGTIYLTSAQTTVTGDLDFITFAGGSDNAVGLYATGEEWDGVDGSDGTIYLTSAQTTVAGGGDVIVFVSGPDDSVGLYATNGAWDGVEGSHGTVFLTSAQTAVTGGGDAIYFSSGSGNAVGLYATDDDWAGVSGSNGTIYLTGAQTAVSGGGDVIYFSGGLDDSVGLYATNGVWDGVYGSNGTIFLTNAETAVQGGDDAIYFTNKTDDAVGLYDTNGAWDGVAGSKGTVFLTSAQASVTGADDTVYFSGGSGDAVAFYQSNGWNNVVGSGGTVYLNEADVTVTGGGDAIDSYFSSDILGLYGTNGDWDGVTAATNPVIYLNDAQTTITGAGVRIYFDGDTGNAVGLFATDGVWDGIQGSNGTIYLNGAGATISGGGDTAVFSSGSDNGVSLVGTDDVFDAVEGSNGSIYLNSAQTAVNGSDDLVALAGTSSVTLAGSADTIAIPQGIGGWDVVGGFGGSDVMQFSKMDFANFSALQADMIQNGANTVVKLNSADKVTLTDVDATSLTASQFTFV